MAISLNCYPHSVQLYTLQEFKVKSRIEMYSWIIHVHVHQIDCYVTGSLINIVQLEASVSGICASLTD